MYIKFLKEIFNPLKGIEFLSQNIISKSIYLCNPMWKTLDISTMKSVRSNNLSLKYQKFAPTGCINIGTRSCLVCG